MHHIMGDLRLGRMAIRYSQFVPKLYNYCLSLGFQRSRMMPSRAFCSDESQGYPVILLAQHFGTFPFDHGRVGGKVATDRHGPHAHHGEDLVIIQASHVGYDAERQRFGVYQRQRTAHGEFGANCGKLSGVLDWYQQEYRHARNDVQLGAVDGAPAVFIDNALLDPHRAEGLFLQLDRFIDPAQPDPLQVLATSKAFAAAPPLLAMVPLAYWQGARRPIGDLLTADLFVFRRQPVVGPEGHDLLEEALAPAMSTLVTSPNPALDAARYHTQIEFDRTYRTIQREPAYHGKNVLFVSGLNVDVSPRGGLLFPLTKFVPWAAYARLRDGTNFLLEQDALFEALAAQPVENADQISFDAAIQTMAAAEGIELPLV
jgi:hypothetical protein